MKTAALLCAAALCLGHAALAQTVALTGMLGGKALLMVDGSAPKSVAVGESFKAVKVLSTQGDTAVLEFAGQRHTLRVGEAPASVGGRSSEASGTRVVLTAGQGGHFFTLGQINGRSINMVIDTGATNVGISVANADRLGINYKSGQRIQSSTANGVVSGWRVRLDSVRVGDVVIREVDASVIAGEMSDVLLGNSFLTRFQMTRTNDQMVLEKRY